MSKTKTQSFPLSRISPLLFHNTTTAKLSEAIDKQSSLLYRREYIVLTETETFVWPPKMSWPMKSNQTLTTTTIIFLLNVSKNERKVFHI
jgi:hypothetical protein